MTETSPFTRWIDNAGEVAARRIVEAGIPMRDGVELAADLYLPPASDEGPVPAIVEVTPYGKDNAVLISDDAELYQKNGYVFVAVDCRGRGKSEGSWSAFENDASDTHDVIEWVARQPFCNGKVGTTGLSYMGWVQWAGASERPEHLAAMISSSAAGRWQEEIPYTHGVFQLYFAWWAFMTRRRIEESYALEHLEWEEILRTVPFGKMGEVVNGSGPSWENLSGRETLDEFWRSLRYDDRYHEIDVPCLHVTGWYDLEDLLGAFHHYEHMVAASPARGSQYLLVGPWSHVKTRYPDHECGGQEFGPEAALDMDAEHLRWFDYWLKGIDTGIATLDRVRLFEPGTNRWVSASAWPLSDSELELHLSSGLLVADEPAEASVTSYRYDPDDPVLTRLDVRKYPLEDIGMEQTETERRPDVVTYTTEPLNEAICVSGWAELELFAASDGDDTDFHVKLCDVGEDGRSFRVTQGCLRAACRDSLEKPEPLVPGETTRFCVELWPTHHVFRPGHRIRLSVTSSDYPWFARSMNRFGRPREMGEPRVAENTILHGGATASRLRLPVVRRGDA